MRARFPAVLRLIGVVVVVAACGGRSLEKEIDKHPAGVLPRAATQIAYAKIDNLRNNPLTVLTYEKTRNFRWGQTFGGVARAMDLVGEISHLALGTYGAGDRAPASVVVATGRFDDAAFRKALKEADVPFLDDSKYDTQSYYVCGRGAERCYVCFPSPQLAIVASQEDLLKETLDLRKSARNTMATNPGGFSFVIQSEQGEEKTISLLDSFSPDLDLWATGMLPRELMAAVAQALPPAVQAIQAFTVKLSGEDTKRFSFAILCMSAETAEANAQVLKGLLSLIPLQLAQAGYKVPELETALVNSQIVVDGVMADFQIDLSLADITAVTETLRAEPVQPPPQPFRMPGAPFGPPGQPLFDNPGNRNTETNQPPSGVE